MNWIFPQHPILSAEQLARLSNIFDNAGQVILAVVVLSPIISGFDKANWIVLILGLIATIFCWVFSIWFAKKGEEVR